MVCSVLKVKRFGRGCALVGAFALLAGCGGGESHVRSWSAPQLIEAFSSGNGGLPRVAMSPAGRAVAVWEQSEGPVVYIAANALGSSGAWGTAGLIETDAAGNAELPTVAVDGAGNAVAVWEKYDGFVDSVWSGRYDAALGVWDAPLPMEADLTDDAQQPDVALDATGTAVAVWYQGIGTPFSVWANRLGSGAGAWGTATQLDSALGDAKDARVAVDATGNAMAVWSQDDGDVWANRYNALGGTWEGDGVIEVRTDTASSPVVVTDGAGNSSAVWSESGGGAKIAASRHVPGTGWGVAGLIEPDTSAISGLPRLAVDGVGNVVAVWLRDISIWANRFEAATGTWGTAAPIESDDVNLASDPDVAMAGAGHAVAVWRQHDGAVYHVWSSRYEVASGTWGPPQALDANPADNAGAPRVATDAAGNAVVVWAQSGGSRLRIWASHFR